MLWNDDVEWWTKVKKKHSYVWVFGVQLCEGWVESSWHGFSGSVGPVSELKWVTRGGGSGFYVLQNYTLETLHCTTEALHLYSVLSFWVGHLWNSIRVRVKESSSYNGYGQTKVVQVRGYRAVISDGREHVFFLLCLHILYCRSCSICKSFFFWLRQVWDMRGYVGCLCRWMCFDNEI